MTREEPAADLDADLSRMYGRIRPFWQGFGLTVVTLGIYPFFWHPISHGELCVQMGRRSQSGGVWGLYVVSLVMGLLVGLAAIPAFIADVRASGPPDDPRTSFREFLEAQPVRLGLIVGFFALAFVLFATYALLQQRLLSETRKSLGLPSAGSPWTFVLLAAVAQVLNGAGGLEYVSGPTRYLSIPILMLAYASLQHDYNGVWTEVERRVRHGEWLAGPGAEAGLEHQPS